jgi:hypothetical protein
MEAVEDVQSVGSLLGNYLKIRRPHVAVNELELCASFLAELPEESEQRFCPVFIAASQKASGTGIEWVTLGQVFVSPEYGDFVKTDLGHVIKVLVSKTEVHNELNCPEYAVPAGFVDIGSFFPGKPYGPSGKINLT